MTIEPFSFDKGINRKKSPIFLEEGELYSCSNFRFEHDGVLECRLPKTRGLIVDSNVLKSPIINGIYTFETRSAINKPNVIAYDTSIYVSTDRSCAGEYELEDIYHNQIWYRDISGSPFTYLSRSGDHAFRPRFENYREFIFVVDGTRGRALTKEHHYDWTFYPPPSPGVVAGAAGLPNGTYNCAVTYYIFFANGHVMETGISGYSTLSVSSKKIEWTNVPIFPAMSQFPAYPYTEDTPTVHRKLYRTVAGIFYYVDTLYDNTTNIYSDNFSNTVLQSHAVLSTEGYGVPPVTKNYTYPNTRATDLAVYLQRIFLIIDNSVCWSEPYLPFNFKASSSIVVGTNNEDLVSIVNWENQLYVASAREWYRLQGADPDSFNLKRTWADVGVINRYCTKKSKYGIIGLWENGIYLFDGSVSKNITEKILGREFFTDLEDKTGCYAEFDGAKYYFYYASPTGTTVDSCLVLDFSYYPEIRASSQDFLADAHFYDRKTDTHYYGRNNYEYSDGGTEKITTSVKTGDKPFQAIIKRKCLDYLYYDLYTDNKDVTVDIYADGVIVQTLTLNTNQRNRKRSVKLQPHEGYRFAIGINCDDSQNLLVYAPWALEATPVGE